MTTAIDTKLLPSWYVPRVSTGRRTTLQSLPNESQLRTTRKAGTSAPALLFDPRRSGQPHAAIASALMRPQSETR